MKSIETGVDKLLELVKQEKKISIDDAAKKLGISKVVIQEWADFLEEEKIITIEYKFSKTFLLERKLSEKEIKTKQKEYSAEKDAFVRKVETSLKNLESDSLGLEKIKKEFETLKKELGGEIGKVEKEVKDLEKYEYLKKNLDKDIQKQIEEFHGILDKAHKDLDLEQKKHQALLQDLEIEKREVKIKEHKLFGLEEKEKELMKRLQEILAISKEVEKKVLSEKVELSASEKKVLSLESSVRAIETEIIKKRTYIQPMIDKSKRHEEDILKLQQDILAKAKEKTDAIRSQVSEGVKATEKFKAFFEKKNQVEELIKNIEKEKKELELSYAALVKKAVAFDLSSDSVSVRGHVKDLEKDLNDVDKKKSKIKSDLEKLIKLVKG